MRQILLISLLFFTFSGIAQDKPLTEPVLTATFLEPGIAYEFPVGYKSTIKARAAITATIATKEYGENKVRLFPRPLIGMSYRKYYNFERREDNRLNTKRNSANYIGVIFLYATKPFNFNKKSELIGNNQYSYYDVTRTLLNTGVVWGIQRNYNSRFSLDLNLGAGYVESGNVQGLSFIGEFTLGFWLNKRRDE